MGCQFDMTICQNLQLFHQLKKFHSSLNPFLNISEDKVFKRVNFTHPYYDQNTLLNQRQLSTIQNKENILYCGSYFGYGFHEDGIKSSIEMIKNLNV